MRRPPLPLHPIAVSIPDAAKLLGFGETYFRSRVLPDLTVLHGSRPRVLVADIERWAEDHKTPPKTAVPVSTSASAGTRPRSRATSDLAMQLTERANRLMQRRAKG
jgi:hypothetical protein